MVRDIHGRFLPKSWEWYRVTVKVDGTPFTRLVLDTNYVSAVERFRMWLSYPVEVEWIK